MELSNLHDTAIAERPAGQQDQSEILAPSMRDRVLDLLIQRNKSKNVFHTIRNTFFPQGEVFSVFEAFILLKESGKTFILLGKYCKHNYSLNKFLEEKSQIYFTLDDIACYAIAQQFAHNPVFSSDNEIMWLIIEHYRTKHPEVS